MPVHLPSHNGQAVLAYLRKEVGGDDKILSVVDDFTYQALRLAHYDAVAMRVNQDWAHHVSADDVAEAYDYLEAVRIATPELSEVDEFLVAIQSRLEFITDDIRRLQDARVDQWGGDAFTFLRSSIVSARKHVDNLRADATLRADAEWDGIDPDTSAAYRRLQGLPTQ